MDERIAFALLLGGEGRRFGGKKQFAPFMGEPLYLCSLKEAARWGRCDSFIVVARPEDMGRVKEETASLPVRPLLVEGGPSRAESARNAVQEAYRLDPEGMILLHDAARPLFDLSVLDRLVEEAKDKGGAVPVLPLEDSALFLEGGEPAGYLARDKVRLVQTPQCFRTRLLHEAEESVGSSRSLYRDEGSLFLMEYGKLGLVEGSPLHRKITRKEDLR